MLMFRRDIKIDIVKGWGWNYSGGTKRWTRWAVCGKGASEFEKLKHRCNELAEKQKILKTKEFKSLSIHLRDLKDDAEAKCTHAREKAGLSIPINSTAGVVENHCHQRTIRNLVAGTST